MDTSQRIEDLRAEARYARLRYDLYRAKTYGPRVTSAARLRQLERMHQGADARLQLAEQDRAARQQATTPGTADRRAPSRPPEET